MANRLGLGEYESVDVETRHSTLKSRHIFLQILHQRKNHLFSELLRLFNPDTLPKEILDERVIDDTAYFFLQYLLSENPHNIEISSEFLEIIDTPLIDYYRYFFDKEDEIKRWENDNELQQFVRPHDQLTRKSNAIKKIIPNWKELKTQQEAGALCQSLEIWAEKYNLNEDWFLDFALRVLRKFKCNYDFELAKFEQSNSSSGKRALYRINYQRKVIDSIRATISDYWHNEIWSNQRLGIDGDLTEFPAFEYRWGNFELSPLTWFPKISFRKEFIDDIRGNLRGEIEHFRYAKRDWSYSNDNELNHLLARCRIELENHCNYTEQQKSEGIDEAGFEPIEFEGIGKTVWLSSKQDKKEFIEDTLAQLKIRIEKTNKAIKSLETFTKKHFATALTKYCNDIETSLPKEWKKTPVKHSENKHFEWLADYQITPCKSYTEIAKGNSADLKTVREAVKKLAEAIKISLREAKRTGRIKGSKNSKTSIRQLGLHKK